MIDPRISFDETTYLRRNSDVAEAIGRGVFPNGLSHWVYFGAYEGRNGSPELDERLARLFSTKSIPVFPPANLRARVHGSEDLQVFQNAGRSIAYDIDRVIYATPIAVPNGAKILDFGCGCGRIIPWLRLLYPDAVFYGTDIDQEAIRWCQMNLSFPANFSCNHVAPPLPFEDHFFDVIIAISVFTHLPEDMQFRWLEELRRVTKPDGSLLISVISAASLRDLPRFDARGFCYIDNCRTDGLPEFYKSAFQSGDYIRNHWSKVFRVRKILSQAIYNHQDLVIANPAQPCLTVGDNK